MEGWMIGARSHEDWTRPGGIRLPRFIMMKMTDILRLSVGVLALSWALRSAAAEDKVATTNAPPTLESLQAEVTALKEMLPHQSHVMLDVGEHVSNLWFAGQRENWPLAAFYLKKTKSHLEWAVSIKPERKTKAGAKLDLKALLGALEAGTLTQLEQAVEAKDPKGFAAAYTATLEGCYNCHVICEKPYLRTHLPERPGAPILSFEVGATGAKP